MEKEEEEKEKEDTTPRGMWGDRYLKRIMANVSIRIDNLIVRYTHENIHTVMTCKVLLCFFLLIGSISKSCRVVPKIIGNTTGRSLA